MGLYAALPVCLFVAAVYCLVRPDRATASRKLSYAIGSTVIGGLVGTLAYIYWQW